MSFGCAASGAGVSRKSGTPTLIHSTGPGTSESIAAAVLTLTVTEAEILKDHDDSDDFTIQTKIGLLVRQSRISLLRLSPPPPARAGQLQDRRAPAA
eukprot:2589392-Rhodomonas_salina.1